MSGTNPGRSEEIVCGGTPEWPAGISDVAGSVCPMRRQSRARAGEYPPSAHTRVGSDWREVIVVAAVACGCVGLTGCAASEQTPGAASEDTSGSTTDGETSSPAAERGATGAPAAITLRGSVTDVVDGDTIKVLSRGFETPVRLLGIDTPETRRPGGFVQCFGPAASARTRRLLPNGQEVRLVTDVSQDRRDRYGRLLAYVYKPGKSGATDSVNHALVATGYAKVFIYRGNPFRHAKPFEEAEARARRRAIGLWGEPCRGDTTKRDPSTIPPPNATPSALAGATSAAPSRGSCDSNYRGACVPPYPPDVDCADVTGSVTVVGRDPHRLDGDGNRFGCE